MKKISCHFLTTMSAPSAQNLNMPPLLKLAKLSRIRNIVKCDIAAHWAPKKSKNCSTKYYKTNFSIVPDTIVEAMNSSLGAEGKFFFDCWRPCVCKRDLRRDLTTLLERIILILPERGGYCHARWFSFTFFFLFICCVIFLSYIVFSFLSFLWIFWDWWTFLPSSFLSWIHICSHLLYKKDKNVDKNE